MALLSSFSEGSYPCQADPPKQPGQAQQVPPKPRDKDAFRFESLKAQPDLPDFPPYPAGHFLLERGGQRFTNLKTGILYNYRMYVTESRSEVVDWYLEALKARKWQVDPASLAGPMLTATRKDNLNFVNIGIQNYAKKPYKSHVLITYKLSNGPPIDLGQ